MAGLRRLLREQPAKGAAAPQWLVRLAAIGITATDPYTRRRQVFTNVGAFAIALNALSHLVSNIAIDFWGLMPLHIYNLAMFLTMLSINRLHRFGDNIAAVAFSVIVLTGHSYAVLALGLDSGLQIYFTISGLMLFLFGVHQWRLFLLFYLLSFVALVGTLRFGLPEGFVMPENTELREFLVVHGLINTIIINGLCLAYALNALRRAELDLARQFSLSEALLHIILPEAVVRRIKSGKEGRIADRIDDATVLFADLAGFTPAANAVDANELVSYLDDLFCKFDALCERHGVDKIKTMGDAYMAVGGLDGRSREGAAAVGRFALDMKAAMEGHGPLGGRTLALRIGIHSGPLVAGVSGDLRLAYDVWGDTVNIAQRMEAHGRAGHIQVSSAFQTLAAEIFDFGSSRVIEVKGLGETTVWFLEGPKDEARRATAPTLT